MILPTHQDWFLGKVNDRFPTYSNHGKTKQKKKMIVIRYMNLKNGNWIKNDERR